MSRPSGQMLMRSGQAKVLPVWAAALRDPDIGGLSYVLRLSRAPLAMALCHPERLEVEDGLCSACARRFTNTEV